MKCHSYNSKHEWKHPANELSCTWKQNSLASGDIRIQVLDLITDSEGAFTQLDNHTRIVKFRQYM